MTPMFRPANPLRRRTKRRAWFTDFELLTHYCEKCNGPLYEDALGGRACLYCDYSEPPPPENEHV